MKSNKLNICTNEEMQEWIANMKNERLVFVDNGIDEDEAETVLQAIGYTLIDTELFEDNPIE